MHEKIKIVIVGGGSAGWFTAASLVKNIGSFVEVTVIESPSIPTISVGESVTPHVQMFFDEIGIPRHQWMRETGAIYKLANRFQGWVTGDPNEIEHFSFTFPFDTNQLYREDSDHLTLEKGLNIDPDGHKISDIMPRLVDQKVFNTFDEGFNSAYHYMKKNVLPFRKEEYLLAQRYSYSQHINSERCGEFVRKYIAKPGGTKHIKSKVVEVIGTKDRINSLKLENGALITGDIFIDASGFHKVLVKSLGWEEVAFADHAIDAAVVGHTSYTDPENQMVNYTQSIAQPHGWQFKIGLYHRMGNGYCYSRNHITDDEAIDHFQKITQDRRTEPRIIKWTPSRLKTFAQGNVATIGLAAGFYEPLEANSLFVITTGIRHLVETLRKFNQTSVLDWKTFNEKLSYSIEDIRDFIRVHYTLSKRTDTDFWNDMRAIGQKRNDLDLLRSKYFDPRNTMISAGEYWTMFPDYMWLQLAVSWGIDTKDWFKDQIISDATLDITKTYLTTKSQRHATVSRHMTNNYQWLREHIFNNLTPQLWEYITFGK